MCECECVCAHVHARGHSFILMEAGAEGFSREGIYLYMDLPKALFGSSIFSLAAFQ